MDEMPHKTILICTVTKYVEAAQRSASSGAQLRHVPI